MSINSWHDSDDVDSEDESAAYNMLYKNNQSIQETNFEPIQIFDNLSKSKDPEGSFEKEKDIEDSVIILSDSDDSFVAKKIVCSNKVAALYVGNSSDSSDDSFFKETKTLHKNSTDIILNIDQKILTKTEIKNSNKIEDWTVDDVEMQPRQKNRSRYFDLNCSSICDICLKKGHSRQECTRSGPVCILCGKEGHISNDCDDIICHICFRTDHISKKCPNSNTFLSQCCRRCNQRGHSKEICPDLWRQYKYTLIPGRPIVQSCSSQNRKSVFCANCSRAGHYTEKCPRNRMKSKFIGPPPIVEIVRFDELDIYENSGLCYTGCPPLLLNRSNKYVEDMDSMIKDMNVSDLLNEVIDDTSMNQSSSSHFELENQNCDFGDGYIMLSPIVKNGLSNKTNKSLQHVDRANIQFSTPHSQKSSKTPLKINGSIIDSTMPSLPESLLKKLFPDETNNTEKISPSLRAKLRKKLKNFLKNGYLPGDSQMTQDKMEFWLQEISTGRSLSYGEKKKLLGSVSAALHSISDRVSNVTTSNNVETDIFEKPFVIKTDIAESRRKRNKNNRQKKSLENELKALQKENKNNYVDLTVEDNDELSLKKRLRKRGQKSEGSLGRRKRQKLRKSSQLTEASVIECL